MKKRKKKDSNITMSRFDTVYNYLVVSHMDNLSSLPLPDKWRYRANYKMRKKCIPYYTCPMFSNEEGKRWIVKMETEMIKVPDETLNTLIEKCAYVHRHIGHRCSMVVSNCSRGESTKKPFFVCKLLKRDNGKPIWAVPFIDYFYLDMMYTIWLFEEMYHYPIWKYKSQLMNMSWARFASVDLIGRNDSYIPSPTDLPQTLQILILYKGKYYRYPTDEQNLPYQIPSLLEKVDVNPVDILRDAICRRDSVANLDRFGDSLDDIPSKEVIHPKVLTDLFRVHKLLAFDSMYHFSHISTSQRGYFVIEYDDEKGYILDGYDSTYLLMNAWTSIGVYLLEESIGVAKRDIHIMPSDFVDYDLLLDYMKRMGDRILPPEIVPSEE